MRYSTTLSALALAFGLMAPDAGAAPYPPTAAEAKIATKIYAGSGGHVDIRDLDKTTVEPTTSILRNNGAVPVTVTCPIVRDTAGDLDFATLHVFGDVKCTIYARTPFNGVTATFERDLGFTGFPVDGRIFTFFKGADVGSVPAGDSLALNCVLPAGGAIIQYRIDEIE